MKKTRTAPKRSALKSVRPQVPPSFEGILFDIDNVLIDTRDSYLETIRWTVEIYLTHGKIPLFQAAPKGERPALLTPADIHQFKLLGGFNDDWDCCYGLLHYLLSLNPKSRTIEALRKEMNLKSLASKASERPLRVEGITKRFGRSPFVMIEKISRIFQEIYLGKDLFAATEKRKALYWNKKGLIRNERLLIKPGHLAKLKAKGLKLGIATGRPRFEATYSLESFGILKLFDAMTTIDEVRMAERMEKKSLRKPHPHSLLETARKMKLKTGLLYVGDLPDDVLAANRAKENLGIHSAAFLAGSDSIPSTLEELKKESPDFILYKADELLKLAQC